MKAVRYKKDKKPAVQSKKTQESGGGVRLIKGKDVVSVEPKTSRLSEIISKDIKCQDS